jgi:hypothetical protein
MITKVIEYRGRVDFVPLTKGRDIIQFFDEVDSSLNALDFTVEIFWGNLAFGPYVYFTADSREKAEELHKQVVDILTRYGYRIIGD